MYWFYNERHHGKGPMDGVGGTANNVVFRDAMPGKCRINSPKELADYGDKRTEFVITVYLPECELFVEPNEVAKAPKIPQTLQVHKVIRHMSANGILYLQLFCLASDEKPFFTQCYRKEGDPEIYGHEVMDVEDGSHCAKCREAENGSDCLCCHLCGNLFHGDCFYIWIICSVFC